MTIYLMDRANLLATHFCPLGNQPRLQLDGVRRTATNSSSDSVNNLECIDDAHQHSLWIHIVDDQTFVRSETCLADGDEGTEAITHDARSR